MRTTLSVAAAVIAVLAGQVPALAGTITASSPTVTQTAFNNAGILTLALAKFDASLGTLTGATLTLDAFTGPQFEVLNFGNVAGTGTGSTLVTYTVSGAGVSGLSGSASSGLQTVTVGPAFLDLASSIPVLSFIDPSVALTDLASLIGSGTIGFDVSELFTTTATTNTSGADLGYGGGASANLGLSIAYTYTAVAAVPEPMSMALLGIGLTGLGIARRGRNRA
jgi:PEP-CTERM motif